MSLESAFKVYEKDELMFTSELGWLGVLAFATVMIIASVQMA
jgi:hypothetical protein